MVTRGKEALLLNVYGLTSHGKIKFELFLKFKKCSNLVFPWKLGPYIVRNKVALTLVSNSLRGMEFPQDQAMNYDPHQVISKRKTNLKCRPFEHMEVPGLIEK